MKKFIFSLQFLLEYKEKKEKKLKKELAEVIKKWRREEAFLNKLKKEEEECQFLLRQRNKEGKISYIILYQSYLERLAQKIKKQEMKVRDIFLKVEDKREKLIRASTEKKTVENLKQKRWMEFIASAKKMEQNFLDESATIKFNAWKNNS